MDFIRRTIAALRSAFTGKAGLLRVTALVAAVLFLTAAMPNAAEACGISDPLSCVAMIFVKIFQLLTALMGWILVLEVEALIRVAQYFNFVTPGPAAVQLGWVVTRDLANMFFIVVLLIIAFGTILGSSTYHYSKNLPRLLIMAVVINFSKTICGIFIDMGQVVMLTFVNGFKETAAGNFMNAYQINKLLALGNTEGSYSFGMVVAMMFAFILATIAVCVTLVLLVIVLFRVVMLWILIILSPLAFLASAIPSAEQYYKDWWRDFKKYIVTGPIIAFFMWLALASVQQSGAGGFASQGFPASYAGAGEAAAAGNIRGGGTVPDSKIPTEAGTADTIMNMVIAISIMFAGLKYASDSGVAGAGVAGAVRGRLEKSARAVATGGLRAGLAPLRLAGGAAANRAKQAGWGVAGSLATRVPGLRGIGAAAKAREAEYAQKRRASIEKFTGTEAQKSQFLPPKAYAARIGGLSNPKQQLEALKLGMGNPAVAAELMKEKNSVYGGKYTEAEKMVSNIMSKGSDKEAVEMAGLLGSDKNLAKAMKNESAAPTLRETRERLQNIANKDANQAGAAASFDQKFMAQLAGMQDQWSDGKPMFMKNADGSDMLGADGKPIPKMILGDAELQKMVPKMSTEDIGGLDAKSIGLLAKHMNDAQFAKARESSRGDSAKADALKTGTLGALAAARKGTDESKIADALKRAMHSGAIGQAELGSDPKLLDIAAKRMNMGSLTSGADSSDDSQRAAISTVMEKIRQTDPARWQNMRKSEQYRQYMPSNEEVAAQRSAQSASLNQEAPAALEALERQIAALSASSAAAPSQAASEEMARLTKTMQSLQSEMAKREGALKSLEGMRERIGMAQGNAQNPATLPMPTAQLDALKKAADDFEKTINDLDTTIAKSVADIKGQKFDTGKPPQGRKRT